MRTWAVLALAVACGGCWAEPWTGRSSSPVCENTCRYAYDGECDDGGPDSLYSLCVLGSDCSDCGVRGGRMGLVLDRRGTIEDCPAGCAPSEACAVEYGCLTRCADASECESGCCVGISSAEQACAPAAVCGE